jgi:hypothetical protein
MSMKNSYLFAKVIVLWIFCMFDISSSAQTFDWRHIARGADTAEIYITCAWYQDTQQWWGGIFRSIDNGENFCLQHKYLYPNGCREVFGDSTQGVLFQSPYGGGIGVSYDYGATFESKTVPVSHYPIGIGGCRKGEFYFEGYLSDTVKVLYYITNFGDSLALVNNQADSLTIREPGSLPGEVYGIQWPYFNGTDTLGLAFSSDYGNTFTINYLDTALLWNLYQITLTSGPAPGELYLIGLVDTSVRYYILHSYDYGQTLELKYVTDPVEWGSQKFSFVAGRAPGTFYILKQEHCCSNPLINCITIYFSRDYGVTYTEYNHAYDSTYTGVPELPPLVGTLTVYPNPATDKLTVEFKGVSEGCDVELLDPMGRLITKKPRLPGERLVEINVGTLPKGVYILRVRNKDRVMGVEKVVVE